MNSSLPFALPSCQELAELSLSSFGYALPAHQLPLYHHLVCSFLLACQGFKKLDELGLDLQDASSHGEGNSSEEQAHLSEEQAHFATNSEPRSFIPVAASSAENVLGAWTVRCSLHGDGDDTASKPSLKGKLVAIKDNIPIRGMPMYCGTSFSFTPLSDSPLITRCLAAGATIVGKAQCEYLCMSATSHTSSAGVVRNPRGHEYHTGGSSSGCAVVVATGEADLSIGGDQGGSIRIPASLTGIVGCKPTHGLVPYTLIDSIYGPMDHAGPMTRMVEDNALMLGVLAGWDGVDERASERARSMKKVGYCDGLKEGVKGMKIGVVKEGLDTAMMEEDVREAVKGTAGLLRQMGAVVEDVSVPLHHTGMGILVLSLLPSMVSRLFYAQEKDALLGVDENGKVCDRLTFMRAHLLGDVASWSFQFRILMLTGEWLRKHFPEGLTIAGVYKKQLIMSYASALSSYDVLMMPTTPCKAKKLPQHFSSGYDYEHASTELFLEHADLGNGLIINTVPTDVTGHPALSVPVGCGMVAMRDEEDKKASMDAGTRGVALPIGAMLVGDYFQEASLYRVAYAIEQAHPWQSMVYTHY